jgi:hypothetical protein
LSPSSHTRRSTSTAISTNKMPLTPKKALLDQYSRMSPLLVRQLRQALFNLAFARSWRNHPTARQWTGALGVNPTLLGLGAPIGVEAPQLSPFTGSFRVGDSGFEPLTSSASRKRSPPELIARAFRRSERRHPESNRGTGFCRPLPNHSAMPPAAPLYPANRGQSGRRDSNPRPSPWQGDALPTELLPPSALI